MGLGARSTPTHLLPRRELAANFRHGRHGSRARIDVPDDTAAALRLLKVLEECRQMDAAEAEAWRRRITGWARFNAVELEVEVESAPSG